MKGTLLGKVVSNYRMNIEDISSYTQIPICGTLSTVVYTIRDYSIRTFYPNINLKWCL